MRRFTLTPRSRACCLRRSLSSGSILTALVTRSANSAGRPGVRVAMSATVERGTGRVVDPARYSKDDARIRANTRELLVAQFARETAASPTPALRPALIVFAVAPSGRRGDEHEHYG